MFLFPFLKELFLGKDNSASKKGKIGAFERLIKLAIIILGCLSVVLNVHLMSKTYSLGREIVQLQRQVKDPTPKPILYPNKDQGPVTTEKRPEGDEETHKKPKKKPIRLEPALPPERESYLKELESIDKIQ